MKTNLIQVWPNVFRGLEIAKAGGLSVCIVWEPDYVNGLADLASLKEFTAGWFDDYVCTQNEADLCLEISQPHPDFISNRKTETLADISERINRTDKDIVPIEINPVALQLLKTAVGRLNLSISTVEKIKLVAGVIAKLELADEIEAVHIAESIQYRTNVEFVLDESELNLIRRIRSGETKIIEWSTEDFEQEARNIEEEDDSIKFDRTKFKEALKLMIDGHDATLGITWADVVYELNELCQEVI